MNAKTKSLLDEALKLPAEQQLELVEQLLAALPVEFDEAEPDLLPELDARWSAFESGQDPGEDAMPAIDSLRRRTSR